MIPTAEVRDGLSNTFLVGEKGLMIDSYDSGTSGGDDDTMYFGANYDSLRTASRSLNVYLGQDLPNFDNYDQFGSAHNSGMHMALCDGSVSFISYSIDRTIYGDLGNRNDGRHIDGNKL